MSKFNGRKRDKKVEISFYIFTHGETEKIYFEDLIKDKGLESESFKIEVVSSSNSDPLQLVKDVAKKVQAEKITAPIWFVFDYDDSEKGRYDNAIKSANASHWDVAYSNDCFELWFFLHFEKFKNPNRRAPLYWDKMTEILRDKGVKFKGRPFTDYKKNGKTLHLYQYPYFKDNLNTALENAKWLTKENQKESDQTPSKLRPSTTVHLLIKALLYDSQPQFKELFD